MQQLQKDPFRDLGQYLTHGGRVSSIDDPTYEKDLNNPHLSDTKKLLSLTKDLPKTELAEAFSQKVKELLETIQKEEPVPVPKPLSDEEYDSFFKASS